MLSLGFLFLTFSMPLRVTFCAPPVVLFHSYVPEKEGAHDAKGLAVGIGICFCFEYPLCRPLAVCPQIVIPNRLWSGIPAVHCARHSYQPCPRHCWWLRNPTLQKTFKAVS